MNASSLSIIVVAYNGRDALSACLDSVFSHIQNIDFEIIVVDNASNDGAAEMVAEKFPQVLLIRNERNEGFSAANNHAFKIAKHDYVLMLNPDTLVTEHAVDTLLQVLTQQPDVGIVGPLILDHQGRTVLACKRGPKNLWRSFLHLLLIDALFHRAALWLLGEVYEAWQERGYRLRSETHFVQGSCMLMRRSDLEAIGYLDESVPLYLDDVDLCERFRKAGKRILFVPDALVIHEGGVSVRSWRNARMTSLVSILADDMFWLKHRGKVYVIAHHVILFWVALLLLAIDLLLLPILFFFKRQWIFQFIAKHWQMLRYAVVFSYRTEALPAHWPRSMRKSE
jgi:GT2 family glycosyltransferase